MSFVLSVQAAGRGGLCLCTRVRVLLDWCLSCQSGWFVHCMEMGEGSRGWETGHWSWEGNLNSVPDFDTNLLWDRREVITLFCLFLQPLPALFMHRLALHTSLSAQAAQKSGG